jgi:hypothetical protein
VGKYKQFLHQPEHTLWICQPYASLCKWLLPGLVVQPLGTAVPAALLLEIHICYTLTANMSWMVVQPSIGNHCLLLISRVQIDTSSKDRSRPYNLLTSS